ncbi:hypothetical protein G7Z17_g7032 [Cylindrodendrum hubeiense]|uniref:WSC domain-containing protein n=1 Tax=Cylindrodendrum hubeiense TaxID=595255 RepID=A0A9P5HDZ6_9HYPO|nr:hypothetical protein G7Z17_g7032 [Cylindrodendrum hubeiense]
MTLEPRPDGGIDGSHGANARPVPLSGPWVENGLPSVSNGVLDTNSPPFGNPPTPGQAQVPSMVPIANSQSVPNDGFGFGSGPVADSGLAPNVGLPLSNGNAPEKPGTPVNNPIPGKVPIDIIHHAPTPLPVPEGTPVPTQLAVPPPVPNLGTGVAPGSAAIPGDDSVTNNNPSPVIMPVPNPENGEIQNNREPIASGWRNLGCFQDSISRTLLGARPADYLRGAMSNDLCIQHCSSRGYSIAGTEDGQECWCGTAIRSDAVRLPENYCGTPCQGGSETVCGGSWAVMVYNRLDATSQPPSPPEYGLMQRDSKVNLKDSGAVLRRPFQEALSTRLGEAKYKIGIREMRQSKRRGTSFVGDDRLIDAKTLRGRSDDPVKD